MEVLLQQIINGLVLGSMYALIALGYTMVYGIINLINFAHGEVLMVGALTSWTIIVWMQESMSGTPGWLILLIALLIASDRLADCLADGPSDCAAHPAQLGKLARHLAPPARRHRVRHLPGERAAAPSDRPSRRRARGDGGARGRAGKSRHLPLNASDCH